MNRPASNHRADDGEIRGWVAEAGDVRVEPRPEHVDQVRLALLERVMRPQVTAIPPEEVETPLGIGLARIVTVACLFAAAIFGVVYLIPRHGDTWANIARALQEKTWVHCVTTGPDGFRQENWFSPRFEILAMKYDNGAGQWGAEFHDLKANTKTEYIVEENTIYRLMEGEKIRKNPTRELEFFQHLCQGESFKVSPYPDSEIVAESQREIVDQGKTWTLHEVTIRGISNRKFQIKMIIRVDPTTGLPRTWDLQEADDTLQQLLDYPATGPFDILALGVPATAKRVDRVPADDLDQVLDRLRIGRERFDDYCAYVWFDKSVNRVWRKGRRWRVELGMPRSTSGASSFEPDRIPDNAGLEWWQEHEPLLSFRLEAICDGQTTWFYRYAPNSVYHDETDTWDHQSVSTQYTYGTPDDPHVPWPHLMPEQVGHTHFGVPDPNWAFFVDLKPDDGPPNTLRLRVRNTLVADPKQPDVYRLWIDPRKNDLVLRAESIVYEPILPAPRRIKRVVVREPAYLETTVLEKFARSPNGFWYPTQVVRKTSNNMPDQVTRFVLDFDRLIPDGLYLLVK